MTRVVLFGASGYTGRLTAAALVRRGIRPILAGRSAEALERLRDELGEDLETATADAWNPASLRRLIEPGCVLISTVGPFTRWGDPAVEAAIAGGAAAYLDSNGEPPFTRRVFERFGSVAAEAGVALLPAFGWECVLGNLAGAIALRDAGPEAVRVDTGYFYTGPTRASAGTRASLLAAIARPGFAYRDRSLREVRGAERLRGFDVDGRSEVAVSFGGSEHLALPRQFTQLREVNAYLGWFGRAPGWVRRSMHRVSRPGTALLRVPGVSRLHRASAAVITRMSREGPSAAERARGGVHVVGLAYDGGGRELAAAHLSGAEGYEFTAAILAWAAEQAAAGQGAGALGPVEAFGLHLIEAGCGECGVARTQSGVAASERQR